MIRKIVPLLLSLLVVRQTQAQETFPVNGVADKRDNCYAFTNATIVKESGNVLANATLVVRDGKIVAVGTQGVAIPKDAVVIDCKDKFIYPSFIEFIPTMVFREASATLLRFAQLLISTPLHKSLLIPRALMAGTKPSARKQRLPAFLWLTMRRRRFGASSDLERC